MKDEMQLTIFVGAWTALMALCFNIGGAIGLIILGLGSIIMGMYAYFQYKDEQATKRERRKVIEGAQRIVKAYRKYEDR